MQLRDNGQIFIEFDYKFSDYKFSDYGKETLQDSGIDRELQQQR